MNTLKIILLCFLLGTPLTAISQSGFRTIRSAENTIAEGNFKKALKQLNRTEKSNYGFCGNVYLEAKDQINILRGVAYLKSKNYEQARASLDAIPWFGQRRDIDSLKVLSYQEQLGTKYLRDRIDAAIPFSMVDCSTDDCYAFIPIADKNMSLKFKIREDFALYLFEENPEKRNEIWIHFFLKSNAYNFIKGENE
ncbi:hypothetical protein [uncultured Dokdonia sp.]|uniref:hypothetical protein n=1 Tax=uncultured Dokdonia sp. TaxID=575653 RepID=UPI0026299AFB|nr:hypothetical protein [uncultured Dokdonia sp.]